MSLSFGSRFGIQTAPMNRFKLEIYWAWCKKGTHLTLQSKVSLKRPHKLEQFKSFWFKSIGTILHGWKLVLDTWRNPSLHVVFSTQNWSSFKYLKLYETVIKELDVVIPYFAFLDCLRSHSNMVIWHELDSLQLWQWVWRDKDNLFQTMLNDIRKFEMVAMQWIHVMVVWCNELVYGCHPVWF